MIANIVRLDDDTEFNFTSYEYPIGGKLLKCSTEVTAQQIISFGDEAAFNNYIKLQMSKDIAKYMMNNRLIEFTRMQNPETLSTLINARCYLVPDNQIKVLRTHYNV